MKVGVCPSCGAPVEFRPGAGQVKVCEHCSTVVFRGELKLESLGKVAELLDLQSPLSVGVQGAYSGSTFTVVGRVQKSNGTGVWDEWCLSFDDARTAWLAESEGDWKLLFPIEGVTPPSPGNLEPLGTFTLRERTFVVEETNSAHTVSAQGQLPAFNAQHRYVDATGPRGTFCTLDEADGTVEAFVGSFVTLKDLGIDVSQLQPTPKREALKQARCTQCNGPLDLKAPDATKRVACPYCAALIKIEGGQLEFLEMLEKPPFEPRIPLGAVGKLHDPTLAAPPPGPAPEWTCIAFLVRSCQVEGTRYPWDEYLLWNETLGFRWLMHSVGHWTWLAPLPAGEVVINSSGVSPLAKYGKETFRRYQSVFATTEYVAGECYWAVAAGEVARATEFIAPPRSINVDQTSTEATVTLGVMLDNALIEKTFGLRKKLNPPVGIAPALPNPFAPKMADAWTWAGLWGAVLLVLAVVFGVLGTTERYFQSNFSVLPNAAPGSPESQRFSEPFEVKADVPLEVQLDAMGLNNNWLGVSVDLVNEKTNEVISVYAEASYYSGVTDGESWSEGSHTATVTTDVVEKGTYVLRTTPTFEPGRSVDYLVTVSADDGPGLFCPLFIVLLLLAAPIYYSVRTNMFETEKWNDAVIQPAPGVSTFPYAKADDDDD
jgi:DNA-directed RNA polymerase subunit RPC12/RpoP